MFLHRKNGRLSVEVLDGSGQVRAGDKSQRTILDELKRVERRVRVIRIDDRRRKVEERSDEAFKGRRQTFLIVTKGGV